MKDMERIKLDREFVKQQIPLSKNRKDLAEKCSCGIDKVMSFIKDNGLYKYYCNVKNLPYNPEKENLTCCICNNKNNVNSLKGKYYCKKHYNQIYRYGNITRTIYDKNDIITEGSISKIILRDKYQNIVGESIIDTEDIDKINKYKWYMSTGYTVTKGIDKNNGTDIANVIFNNYNAMYDHIDHNRMNNRKQNLRVVTSHQNAMNMGKKYTNKTGVTGINRQNGKMQLR